MTRTTNARVAGITFLLYIAIGVASLVVGRGATAGDVTAARLASIAAHAPQLRATMLLGMLTGFCAFVLGVALYGLTRDEDHDLALLALLCRAAEGILGAIPVSVALLWLANVGGGGPDAAAAGALAPLLFKVGSWKTLIGSTFFAVGSTIFCWLFVRGRIVPAALAWLGVVASVLLAVVVPLQLAGIVSGPFTNYAWAPMAVFEVAVAGWLLVKGAAAPARTA